LATARGCTASIWERRTFISRATRGHFYRIADDGNVVEILRVIDGRRDLGTVFFE